MNIPARPMELNARAATIVLLAVVAAELLCGIGLGVTAVVLTWPDGIHDSAKLQRMIDKLAPLTILMSLVAIPVTIRISKALAPVSLKDATPTGAAWFSGILSASRRG